MQLTKDDVITEYEIFKLQAQDKTRPKDIKKLDYSKFQQVMEFYDIYCDNHWELKKTNHEVWKKFLKYRKSQSLFERGETSLVNDWHYWLFNYCFKDGLK